MAINQDEECLPIIGTSEYKHSSVTGDVLHCRLCGKAYELVKCHVKRDDGAEFDGRCYCCSQCKRIWFHDEETRNRYEISLT